MVDGIAHGILGEDDARCRIADARRRRDDAKAGLEALATKPKSLFGTPPAKMPPGFLTKSIFLVPSATGSKEIATALRELIAAIVIHPAGRDEPRIEVISRLAKLTGTDLFPQVSLTTAVAGARFVHSRHPNKTGDHPLGFVFILPQVKAR